MRRQHCHVRPLIRGRRSHRDPVGHRDPVLERRLALLRRREHLDWVRHDRGRDLAFDRREPGGLVEAASSPDWVEVRLAQRDPCRCLT